MADDDALAATWQLRGDLDPLARTLTEAKAVSKAGAAPEPTPTGASRYERCEEIGRGGMGIVCRAIDKQFSRDVALKQMRSELAGGGYAERFATECLITGNLEHPGIPAVYERGEVDGSPFYTMRRVRGRTLKEALDQSRSPDERLTLVSALTRVAQTLAYAHSRGVVHRDIKPSNIVLGDFGETFVLDWGVAKVRGLVDSPANRISGDGSLATLDGSVVGTPSYMAPEQAEGRIDATDERSDVFALGALLYHILTGGPPYTGSTSDELVAKAKRSDFESIHKMAPTAPRSLRSICDRAMAHNSVDRFRTAGEMAGALEQFTANAVAHQDSGPVGWFARAVTVFSGLLALASVGVFISLLPRFREFGFGAYPTLGFTIIGLTLSGLDFATSGRYLLGPLILAMAAATFLAGFLAVSVGFDSVLAFALDPEIFESPDLYRGHMTQGAREVIGNITLSAAMTMSQMFAWAIARRRALRS